MSFLWLLALAAPLVEFCSEFTRPDPYGATVTVDRDAKPELARWRVARRAFFSAHLVIRLAEPGSYTLKLESDLPADLYREWYHKIGQEYFPDGLIPVSYPVTGQLPAPDNRVPGQTAQAYWLDVWAPADAKPGPYRLKVRVEGPGGAAEKAATITVTQALTPAEDTMSIDHNSYGSTFLAEQYPQLAASYGAKWTTSDAFFRLIHAYHRIFYEHRGVYHQLGYGHGGKVAPEFAPELTGQGRTRGVKSWELYDRHFGPLLDGSAFANTRRGARPIPYVYLPTNPEWPASFVNWGEPGYAAEFTSVVKEMEAHFRGKGWTGTRFELFFNHKKRYKAFPWDGDEVRFLEDDRYFMEYWRLWRAAVPATTPVQFVFRADSSWAIEQQAADLRGVVNFWVCSSGMLTWMKDTARQLKARGDIVWHYSGSPAIQENSSAITRYPMRTWVWDIDGFVHWLAVAPERDPWFQSAGARTALVYSGERFGIEGPVPTIRLKLQRNVLQDLAAMNRRRLAAVVRAYNDTAPDQWWTPRPALASRPPNTINNADTDDAAQPADSPLKKTSAGAWQRVREVME